MAEKERRTGGGWAGIGRRRMGGEILLAANGELSPKQTPFSPRLEDVHRLFFSFPCCVLRPLGEACCDMDVDLIAEHKRG